MGAFFALIGGIFTSIQGAVYLPASSTIGRENKEPEFLRSISPEFLRSISQSVLKNLKIKKNKELEDVVEEKKSDSVLQLQAV